MRERQELVAPSQPARIPHPSAPVPVQGRPLGSNVRVDLGLSGLRVFPMMLGAGEFGWSIDQPHAFEILDRYRELGGNVLHGSDGYAAGRSEHIIGRWLQDRGVRDETVLAIRVGGHPDNPGLGSVNLVRAVEASLTRLGTDHIDMLYLDGTDTRSPLEDTLATAEWLVETGKARALGAYAFSAERLVEARILSTAGYPRITAIDVPYNLAQQEALEGDMKFVVGAQQLALTPSRALAHGFLSGAHRPRAQLNARGARGQQMLGAANRRGAKIMKAIDAMAAQLSVPPAAIALGWLRALRTVAAPIVNVYATSHVDEMVQGVGVTLGRAQLAELNRAAS